MNMTPLSGSNKIVVVGGGAAGMMAAGMAAQAGAQVTLLEQNGRLGKKLLITGKGRCNVTNDCPWQDVLQSVPTNGRSPFWMRSNGSCVHTMCVSCRAKRRRSPFPMAA